MIKLNTLLAEAKLSMSIPSDIKKLYSIFKKNGHQLYVVGGAVRDAILGSSPKDFDLATDAKPDKVLQMAKDAGIKSVEVGKAFGVVMVGGHEIATFRKDIGSGRRPDAVDFTDIKGDVQRRDLTINALFYDIGRGEIVDLVGGIKDLKKKCIRCVGDAGKRFAEDPLRKLRAVRFTGSTGGSMEQQTYEALRKNPNISGVSSERVRDEFIKGIQKAKSVSNYLKLCNDLGLLKQILKGLSIDTGFKNIQDYIVQIAYLLRKNNPMKVNSQLKSLKYQNQEAFDIWFLLILMKFNAKNIYMYKTEQKKTKLSSSQLKLWGSLSGQGSWITKMDRFKLSVKGGDVAKMGLRGADIGNKIKELEYQKFK
jgi:tRNA nucleotidyltransferase/poly(A) polymerase